ncbi:MAG: DUF4410 domain-containing protein [Calditrichia bacterium]
MKRTKIIGKPILFFAALILSSCAGNQMVTQHQLEKNLDAYPVLNFAVETSMNENIVNEMAVLRAKVHKKLQDLNLFQNIEFVDKPEPAEGKLLVKATITEIRKVIGAKRFFLGALAGKAAITVDVVFIDIATEEVLGSYTVTGKSGGSGLSGGTEDAIKKTAEAIVELISSNYDKIVTNT